jgi:hypothetical protein
MDQQMHYMNRQISKTASMGSLHALCATESELNDNGEKFKYQLLLGEKWQKG